MKSKPRATWTIAILITVLLSITISHDVWLFLASWYRRLPRW